MFLNKKIIFFLVIIISFGGMEEVLAEQSRPNVSIGPVVSGGLYNYYLYKKEDIPLESFETGKHLGGGVALQKMFSNRWGIDSGFFYTFRTITFSLKGTPDMFQWEDQVISMPLRIITSFNHSSFSLNLLTGVKYSHLFKRSFKFKSSGKDGPRGVIEGMNANQMALSLGMHFKFRVGKYHDLFFGIEGDGNFTADLRTDTFLKKTIHYYHGSLVAGYLMRTNFFPIQTD